MVEVVLILVGRLFQAAGPATLKARSPKFLFIVRLYTIYFFLLDIPQKSLLIAATCEEYSSLNYQEIKCININKIINVTVTHHAGVVVGSLLLRAAPVTMGSCRPV